MNAKGRLYSSMLMMMALAGEQPHGPIIIDPTTIRTPDYKTKVLAKKPGVTRYEIDGVVVYARSLKNAEKKAKRLKS